MVRDYYDDVRYAGKYFDVDDIFDDYAAAQVDDLDDDLCDDDDGWDDDDDDWGDDDWGDDDNFEDDEIVNGFHRRITALQMEDSDEDGISDFEESRDYWSN